MDDGSDRTAAATAYFLISLCCGERVIERLGLLEFASLDDARDDVAAAIPDTAADLIRQGLNPLNCRFRIADEDGCALLDVPLDSGIGRVGDGHALQAADGMSGSSPGPGHA